MHVSSLAVSPLVTVDEPASLYVHSTATLSLAYVVNDSAAVVVVPGA